MVLDDVSDQDLVRSLRSELCPFCGRTKRAAQTGCFRCYRQLPRDEQLALYDLLGQGYREAVVAACTRLDVQVFRLPGTPPVRSTPAPLLPGLGEEGGVSA